MGRIHRQLGSVARQLSSFGGSQKLADPNHHTCRIGATAACPPAGNLRGEISGGLPSKGGIGGAQALPQFPMTYGASDDSALGVSRDEKTRGCGHRLSGSGERLCPIKCGYAGPIRGGELASDPAHLTVLPAPIRICLELAQEISRINRRQPRYAGSVSLPSQAMAREARILCSCETTAQGDKFPGLPETITRSRIGGAARCKSECHCRTQAAVSECHGSEPTCLATVKFQRFSHSCLIHGVAIAGIGLSLAACKPPPQEPPAIPLANAALGKQAIERAGCGSCHTIEGIWWPQGRAAPELRGIANRAMIAGKVPNRPDLLAAFVRNAPAVAPGTTMPAMPVSEQESRDIVAYLYETGG